jgi:hypothetical protein
MCTLALNLERMWWCPAGADGRIHAWRLAPSRDDLLENQEVETMLESPYGAGAPAPRIRTAKVAAGGTGSESVGRGGEGRPAHWGSMGAVPAGGRS